MTAPAWVEELRAVPVIKPARWCEISGMPRSTVYDQIANGGLPSIRLGKGDILMPTTALLKLLGVDAEEDVD